LRSPLRNPASSHGRHQTTELNFVLIHYRREEIEAGSRSPLHNPASTHGRHKKTAELKLIHTSYQFPITKITEQVLALLIFRLYKSSPKIFVGSHLRVGNGNECATKDYVTSQADVPQSFLRTQGIIVLASKIMAAGIRQISVRYGHAQTGNGMKS